MTQQLLFSLLARFLILLPELSFEECVNSMKIQKIHLDALLMILIEISHGGLANINFDLL